jgi:hypothetical protein
MRRTALAILLLAGIASAEDSPLVALAKRTNRKAPKSPVITNQTIGTHAGRVSFAGGQMPPINLTAPPDSSSAKATNTTQTTAATATTQTTATPTPPSTARNIQPPSSARNVDPSSGARAVAPQSTGATVPPASTAQTVQPQATAKSQ